MVREDKENKEYRHWTQEEIDFIFKCQRKKIESGVFIDLFCKKFDRTTYGILYKLKKLTKKHRELISYRKEVQKLRQREYYNAPKGKKIILKSNKRWNKKNIKKNKKAMQNRRVLNPGVHEKRCHNYWWTHLEELTKYEKNRQLNARWDTAIKVERKRRIYEKKFKEFYSKILEKIENGNLIRYSDLVELIGFGLKKYVKEWGDKDRCEKIINPPVSRQMGYRYSHFNRFKTFMPQQTLEIMLKEAHIKLEIIDYVKDYNPNIKGQKANRKYGKENYAKKTL